MNLFREIAENEKQIHSSEHLTIERHKIEKYESKETIVNLSFLSQFFIAPNLLVDSSSSFHIPVGGNEMLAEMLNKIAPHFNTVNLVKIEERVKEVIFQHVCKRKVYTIVETGFKK